MKTSRGYEVEFVGIATAMDELERHRVFPEPPKYYVDLPGTLDPATNKPRQEEHFHDATTLETDEEKAAYSKYLAAMQAERRSYNEKALKMTILRGVKIEAPDLTVWKSERAFLGLPIPEDPSELKYTWIYTEVIGSIEDLRMIQNGVEAASGVSEEQISATEDLFRHKMGKPGGNTTQEPSPAGNGSGVVLQHTAGASESGDSVAPTRKRIRRVKQ